jgi:hypothetical protein
VRIVVQASDGAAHNTAFWLELLQNLAGLGLLAISSAPAHQPVADCSTPEALGALAPSMLQWALL